MAKSNRTRIGPQREGYEYQDAEAVKLFLSWLEDLSMYQWVKLEADEYGYFCHLNLLLIPNLGCYYKPLQLFLVVLAELFQAN